MFRFSGITLRFPKLVVLLETLVFTLLAPVIGCFLNSGDPFFVRADFPWLWFGPLLIALRYGMAPALGSITLLTIAWFGFTLNGLTSGVFPLDFMLGGLLLVLLAGQFSSTWTAKLRRSDLLSKHAAERLEQISRAYFMVRHSHDRLEQNLVSRPVTLRQALMELHRLLADDGGGLISSKFAGELMVILSHYCSLTSASLYAVNNEKVDPEPLAQCGNGAPYIHDDLLLRSAIESGVTAYQAVNRLAEGQHSNYLVVAPLRSSSGQLLGLLLVSDMPFMALHRETLQILGVLLAYTADHVEAAVVAGNMLAVYPDCPLIFAAELAKMVHLRRKLEVVSAMAMVSIKPGPLSVDIASSLNSSQRGLDHNWFREIGWGIQLVTLMPFSGKAALDGFKDRMDDILKEKFHITLNSAGVFFKAVIITGEDPLLQLAGLLAEQE